MVTHQRYRRSRRPCRIGGKAVFPGRIDLVTSGAACPITRVVQLDDAGQLEKADLKIMIRVGAMVRNEVDRQWIRLGGRLERGGSSARSHDTTRGDQLCASRSI